MIKLRFVSFVSWRFIGGGSQGHLLGFLSRLAMLGLVLSVSLLIMVLSVMNGFDRELREKILSIVPHISVYHSSGELLDWPILKKQFEANPEVLAVTPFSETEGLLKVGSRTEAALFHGVFSKSGEIPLLLKELDQYLPKDDSESFLNNEQGLLLGENIAKKLQVKKGDFALLLIPIPVDKNGSSNNAGLSQSTKIISHGFRVSGVFQTGTEIDKALVLIHDSFFSNKMHKKAPSGLRVKLKDLFSAPSVQQQLMQSLPLEYYARSWSRTHGSLYEAVQMSRAMVAMLMYVIIAVAVFNVVSTLVLAGFEKRQAIAILRVQGASRKQIAQLFVSQGALIGLIGAGMGAVLGVLLSYALPSLMNVFERIWGTQLLNVEIYPISYIPSDVRIEQVLSIVAVAAIFSIMAAFYPAWRASKIEPASVLRYE